MQSRLVNRNIIAVRGRSSMRLEPEIWDALQEICKRERVALGDLVQKVEGNQSEGGRTSARAGVRLPVFPRRGHG